MHPRLAAEWPDVLEVYPDLVYRDGPDRIEVGVDLDRQLYNADRTTVGVLVPAGYPATGPDGFLVPASLQMNGGLPASDATSIGMPGWLLVSFHMFDTSGRPTWRATSDPKKGDNLIGYLASIEHFLAKSCS